MTPEILRQLHRIYALSRMTGLDLRRLLSLLSLLALVLILIASSQAQQPSVEAAVIRGSFSGGSSNWDARSFGWFYYDIDHGYGGEKLSIKPVGRTISKGDLRYTSSVWSEDFENEPWGKYDAVAFMGKRYLAGYHKSNFTDAKSALSDGELREILIDDKEPHTLTYNGTLNLLGGYALFLADISESNDVVHLILAKNGMPMAQAVISTGGTHAFKQGDLPLIIVHISDAMKGDKAGIAQIEGVFQVSDQPIKLYQGEKLDNLEVTDVSDDGITLGNYKDVTLSRDCFATLYGSFGLMVIDNPTLVYYPEGDVAEYSYHEIRGPIFDENSSVSAEFGTTPVRAVARWNPANFSGFYFDPGKEIGTESLVVYATQGRYIMALRPPEVVNNTVKLYGMEYSTSVQPKAFERKAWGSYRVICFLGQIWFAGYGPDTSSEIGSKGLIDNERLGQVLIDTDETKIAQAGNVLQLADSFEFLIKDVNKEKVFAQLRQNGKPLEDVVISSNSTYIYKRDIGDITDFPLLCIHIRNIFSDGSMTKTEVDGIFQISDMTMPAERSMDFGELTIYATTPNFIIMGNTDNVELKRESSISIWPGMNLRVADNDSLRYYLYTVAYVVPKPLITGINYPKVANTTIKANFSMAAVAAQIVGITAEILDSEGRTVYARDLTALGTGSEDHWAYSWQWNVTTLAMSDDGSPVMDVGPGNAVPALLYLNSTIQPIPVGVRFDTIGRLALISSGRIIYYISKSEYEGSSHPLTYGAMLMNATVRKDYLQVQPGSSLLKLYDIIDEATVPQKSNHTLSGDIGSLEPNLESIPSAPGKYELRIRLENSADALRVGGIYFNVTEPLGGIVSLSSAYASPGDNATMALTVPVTKNETRAEMSYDPSVLKALGATGPCNTPSRIDQEADNMWVMMPPLCTSANLTFRVEKANTTSEVKIIKIEGITPDGIINGSITVSSEQGTSGQGAGDQGTEVVQVKPKYETFKSISPIIAFSLLALILTALAKRRS